MLRRRARVIGPKSGDVKICATDNQHVRALDCFTFYRGQVIQEVSGLFSRPLGVKTDLIIIGLPLVRGVPISGSQAGKVVSHLRPQVGYANAEHSRDHDSGSYSYSFSFHSVSSVMVRLLFARMIRAFLVGHALCTARRCKETEPVYGQLQKSSIGSFTDVLNRRRWVMMQPERPLNCCFCISISRFPARSKSRS